MEKIKTKILEHSPIIIFVIVFLLFSISSNKFLEFQNIENIIKQASYIGIVAIGMTFVLITAGIDLSVGSNMYLSGVVTGIVINQFQVSAEVGFLVCMVVGALFGLVNAFIITKLKIIPFVATLGTMVLGRGIGLALTESKGLQFPEDVLSIGTIKLFNVIPLPIFFLIVITLISYFMLNFTQSGRQMYAVGNNIEYAKKAGINTDKVLQKTYVISGIFASIGGFISISQLGIINSGFGSGYEFDAIAAAVLGGTSLFGGIGSVFPGTILGALLIQIISTGLVFTQVNIYLQPIITGGIIFLAVLLDSLRSGIVKKMGKRKIRLDE